MYLATSRSNYLSLSEDIRKKAADVTLTIARIKATIVIPKMNTRQISKPDVENEHDILTIGNTHTTNYKYKI